MRSCVPYKVWNSVLTASTAGHVLIAVRSALCVLVSLAVPAICSGVN